MDARTTQKQNRALGVLKRLACGRVNDAVYLLTHFHEIDPETVSRLDLFPVSEIKQTKDGGLEIKFYDRLRAIELLASAERQNAPDAADSFYGALEFAAKSACDADAV